MAFLRLRLATLQVNRFVGRQIFNTLMCGQHRNRALTFCGQTTDNLWAVHGRSADSAWTICGQCMDDLQTVHGRSADRAQTFLRHSYFFLPKSTVCQSRNSMNVHEIFSRAFIPALQTGCRNVPTAEHFPRNMVNLRSRQDCFHPPGESGLAM